MSNSALGATNMSNGNGVLPSSSAVQSYDEWDDLSLNSLFDFETYDRDTSESTSTTPLESKPSTSAEAATALDAPADSSFSVAPADTLTTNQSVTASDITDESEAGDDSDSTKLGKETQSTVSSACLSDQASPVLDKQDEENQRASDCPPEEQESVVTNSNNAEGEDDKAATVSEGTTTAGATLPDDKAARSTPKPWGEFVREYQTKQKRVRSTSDDEGDDKSDGKWATKRITKKKKCPTVPQEKAKSKPIVTSEPVVATHNSTEHDVARKSQIHLSQVLDKELEARRGGAAVRPPPVANPRLAGNPYASTVLWKAPTGVPPPLPMAVPALPVVMCPISCAPVAVASAASPRSLPIINPAPAGNPYVGTTLMFIPPRAPLPAPPIAALAGNPYAALALMVSPPSAPPCFTAAAGHPIARNNTPVHPTAVAPAASSPTTHTQIARAIEPIFVDVTPVVTNAKTLDPPKAESATTDSKAKRKELNVRWHTVNKTTFTGSKASENPKHYLPMHDAC